jgi:hypothetical protein
MEKTKEKESKMKKDSKNSPTKSPNKSPLKTETSPKKFNTIEHSHLPEAYPKNANEFRHILDDIKCCHADVDFMLDLRRYTKINSPEKITLNEPSFYNEDLTKYKNKTLLKPEERKMLQVNLGRYKYILSDRAKYAINNPTFKYEVRLRTEPTYLSKIFNKNKIKNKEIDEDNKGKKNLKINTKNWDPTLIHPNKSLFDTLLPPILPQSKEVFSKNEKRVGRPIIIKRKDGMIDGKKIRGRIFDYNNILALRYPSDHLPNSRYSNDYGVSNLGEIRHLLNSDNRTMTSNWSSCLRGIKKKSVSPDDIKKTEQKLRDKSNKKSVIK